MKMQEPPDRIQVQGSVSIPDGLTVAEVNAAGDAASAARAKQRDKDENR